MNGVLGNDTDADDNTLTAILVQGPLHGTLSLTVDGNFIYTPTANYNGADSFTYKANDGIADSNVATVSITVTPVNDAPAAVDDSYNVDEDATLTVDGVGVLANDLDVDGNALTAALVVGPAHGVLSLNANGTFTYTPALNYSGPDGFTYKARDGTVDSNVASVSITVSSTNDGPVAVGDTVTTPEDTAVVIPVLANDTDGDADTLSVTSVGTPAHGSVVINPDKTIAYTPAANYHGSDSFTYTVNDGRAGIATATVDVTVTSVNDVPAAVNDTAATAEDTPATIAVLANDTDLDGDTLAVSSVTAPAHGVAVDPPGQDHRLHAGGELQRRG